MNEARVVVRLDATSALGDLEACLGRWFHAIELHGKEHRSWYPSVWKLADSACSPGSGPARRAHRDRTIASLMAAAVSGSPIPRRVMQAVVGRIRAEREVTQVRIALLRLCRGFHEEENMSQTESVGSLCGRLLAQLEAAQYAALGETNRTIVDRYYAAASVNPQRVFPRLAQRAQSHLSKAGLTGPRLVVQLL